MGDEDRDRKKHHAGLLNAELTQLREEDSSFGCEDCSARVSAKAISFSATHRGGTGYFLSLVR